MRKNEDGGRIGMMEEERGRKRMEGESRRRMNKDGGRIRMNKDGE